MTARSARPVQPIDLPELIDNAWNEVLAQMASGNSNRSTAWVNALAEQFAGRYEARGDHRVFWRSNTCNKREFGLNEFLFDIVACEVGTTCSLQHQPKELEFVAQCHWLVESEFARDTRAIVVDMSKLVIGAALYKLFVAAHRTRDSERKLLRRCAPIARCCGGEMFFLFISHPDDWASERQRDPVLHEWVAEDDCWRRVSTNRPESRKPA